jgi:hypothetical protein
MRKFLCGLTRLHLRGKSNVLLELVIGAGLGRKDGNRWKGVSSVNRERQRQK